MACVSHLKRRGFRPSVRCGSAWRVILHGVWFCTQCCSARSVVTEAEINTTDVSIIHFDWISGTRLMRCKVKGLKMNILKSLISETPCQTYMCTEEEFYNLWLILNESWGTGICISSSPGTRPTSDALIHSVFLNRILRVSGLGGGGLGRLRGELYHMLRRRVWHLAFLQTEIRYGDEWSFYGIKRRQHDTGTLKKCIKSATLFH